MQSPQTLLALVLAVALAGCGGGCASSEPSSTDQEAPATPPVAEEAEPAIDITSLQNEVTGSWRLDSALIDGQAISQSDMIRFENQGVIWYITFTPEMSFSLYKHTGGADNIMFEGTWNIDEQGALNLALSNGIPFTTSDISSSVILKTPNNVQTENGTWKLGLSKLSDQQLAGAIAAADAISPAIALGQTIETENYTFELTGAELMSEIYPPDTSSYYRYYEDMADSQYYVVRGTFKNTGSNFADLRYGTKATFTFNGEYEIEGEVEACRSDSSDFDAYQMNPLETVQLYIYCTVPNEMAEQLDSIQMSWQFANDLTTFFDEANLSATYTLNV